MPVAGILMWAASLPAGGSPALADDVLPAPMPLARYEKMGSHSPFSPPTAAAPVSAAPAARSWADKLTVTLLMQEAGNYIATVVDGDTSEHFMVTSEKENERGIMLSSVQWSDKASDTKVTLRKGTEFGQVTFNPSAGAAPALPPQPGVPGYPPGKPPIPGAPVFHPPPGANSGNFNSPGQPTSPSNVVRRPVIHSAPPPIVTPRIAPGRPPVSSPDADDDDDN